jgi:LysM repeat protein
MNPLRLGFAASGLILPLALLLLSPGIAAAGSQSVSARRHTSYAPVPPSYAEAARSSSQLAARVDKIAKNDQRQDARLSTLERDVKTLKPTAGTRTSAAPAAAAAPTGKLHVVRSGETLWRIAAKYNTSVNAIRQANRISGDTVAVGQALVIPVDEPATKAPETPSVHVVAAGETFSGIAHRYKVSQDALARANPKSRPDRVLVGEKLVIPAAKTVAVPTYTAPVPQPAASAPAGPHHHVVQPGESLGAIAKHYGMPTATLAAANKLDNPNLLQVGRRLVIPTVQGPSPAAAPAPAMPEEPRQVKHNYLPAELPVTPAPPPSVAAPEPPPAPPPAPAKPSPMPVGATRGVVAYRLEKGDDLTTVANMFSTTAAKIRELNMLPPNAELKEGDEIVVPALSPAAVE